MILIMNVKGIIKVYKEDMGYRIKYLRKYVCGYSQRRLAKLVEEDIETIRMLEDGRIKNPQPSLILRISDVLDSFICILLRKSMKMSFCTF